MEKKSFTAKKICLSNRSDSNCNELPLWARAEAEVFFGVLNWLSFNKKNDETFIIGAFRFLEVYKIELPFKLSEFKELVRYIVLWKTTDYSSLTDFDKQMLKNFLTIRQDCAKDVSKENLSILGLGK